MNTRRELIDEDEIDRSDLTVTLPYYDAWAVKRAIDARLARPEGLDVPDRQGLERVGRALHRMLNDRIYRFVTVRETRVQAPGARDRYEPDPDRAWDERADRE